MAHQQMMLHQVHVAVEGSSVTDVDDARAGHPFPAAALVNHEADVIVLAEQEEFEPGNAAMSREICADGLRNGAGNAVVIRSDNVGPDHGFDGRKIRQYDDVIAERPEPEVNEDFRNLRVRGEHREMVSALSKHVQREAYAMAAIVVQHAPAVRIAEPFPAAVQRLVGIDGAEDSDQPVTVVGLKTEVGSRVAPRMSQRAHPRLGSNARVQVLIEEAADSSEIGFADRCNANARRAQGVGTGVSA